GEIAQPGLDRPALAAARGAVERERGEEGRALPGPLRRPLDHALACRIERDHLDHAWLGVGIIDPEPRLRGRAHARAFGFHVLVGPIAIEAAFPEIAVASPPVRRQRGAFACPPPASTSAGPVTSPPAARSRSRPKGSRSPSSTSTASSTS